MPTSTYEYFFFVNFLLFIFDTIGRLLSRYLYSGFGLRRVIFLSGPFKPRDCEQRPPEHLLVNLYAGTTPFATVPSNLSFSSLSFDFVLFPLRSELSHSRATPTVSFTRASFFFFFFSRRLLVSRGGVAVRREKGGSSTRDTL